MDRYCYFNEHSRSYEYHTAFLYKYVDTDDFAIQYDQCIVSSRWDDWAEWSACDVSCAGGTKTRTRNCLKKEGNNWVEDNDLIGQDCQCQGIRVESGPCNTQCCVEWYQCTPGTDCFNDEDFEV